MKSFLSNVCGMAAVVSCLALGFNRPAGAEETAHAKEHVKQEVHTQTQVIVVEAKGETDIAEAVKKSLGDKLKGLPNEVQAQIMQQLKGLETHQPLNVQVVPVHKAQTIQKSDGDKQAIAIAVSVDGDEVSAKDISKEISVTVQDGKVILNGKPVADLKAAGEKKIRVEIKKPAGQEVKRSPHRKMVFVDQDGKTQEFELDINVDTEHVVIGTIDDAKTIEAGPHADVVRRLVKGKVNQHPKHEIHVRALRLEGDKLVSPHHDAALAGGAHADQAHAEVTKRLKGIESELRKIRKLLEKMQDGDEDQHEQEHEQEHEHEHEHED